MVRRIRDLGLLTTLLTALALALPTVSAADIPGPAGQGDASSAQYAPFLGGRGGPLVGPYTPPVLDRSSPPGISGLLLVLELAGAGLLVGGAALAVRSRLAGGDRPLVTAGGGPPANA